MTGRIRQLRGALALIVACSILVMVPQTSQAAISTLCTGYDSCNLAGRPHYGYKERSGVQYWGMFAGHNCTNYVAYRFVNRGMPNQRPWNGDGNASNWGVAMAAKTNGTPVRGAVAWWAANRSPAGPTGHVAYVEQVNSDGSIVISEDNWGGDFHWKIITPDGSGWPSGFIHINDDPQGPANQDPIGAFDGASGGFGTVRLSGWAADRDLGTGAIAVHAYIGGPVGQGEGHDLGLASRSRPDVGRAFPGIGDNHGFDQTVTTSKRGTQRVYLYAINYPGGTNPLIGIKEATIASPDPVGYLDSVTSKTAGTVTVQGWAFDPEAPKSPVTIRVYVGGPSGSGKRAYDQTTGVSRPDVPRVHPQAGQNQGFKIDVPTDEVGTKNVYVYALNKAGTRGVNVSLGNMTTVINKAYRASVTSQAVSTATSRDSTYLVRWRPTKPLPVGSTFDVQAREVRVSSRKRTFSTARTLVSGSSSRSTRVKSAAGRTTEYRVRVRRGGSVSPWSSWSSTVVPFDDRSTHLSWDGRWTSSTVRDAYRGTVRRTSTNGSVKVSGQYARSIYVIGGRGPQGGSARVYVDGRLRKTVSTYSTKTRNRQILASVTVPWGRHSIKVVKAAAPRKSLTIDGIAFRR